MTHTTARYVGLRSCVIGLAIVAIARAAVRTIGRKVSVMATVASPLPVAEKIGELIITAAIAAAA
ncbi:hypothetical protein LG322_14205 [Microbacterium aerolatum]|uniref:hypothetical protein n=1 Tax=Microbacterium aerolatum TaxID=153731 RepID=UPI001887299A